MKNEMLYNIRIAKQPLDKSFDFCVLRPTKCKVLPKLYYGEFRRFHKNMRNYP